MPSNKCINFVPYNAWFNESMTGLICCSHPTGQDSRNQITGESNRIQAFVRLMIVGQHRIGTKNRLI